MSGMRRALVALSGALVVAAAIGPPVFAHPPDKLEKVHRRLEKRENQLEATKEKSRSVRGQLSQAQQHRQSLTIEVRGLQSDLVVAQADLAQVQAALDIARDELDLWRSRLKRARARLLAQESQLNARAATAYKLGPSAYLEALLGPGDLSSLADRTFYVEQVLTIDVGLLDGVRVARTLVADRRGRVGGYEDAVAKQFRRVRKHTEQIAAMKAQRESLLEQIDLEIDYSAETLGDLTAARERYERAVAALEAQSAQIQGLILGIGSTGSGRYGGELFWPTAGPIVSGFGYRVHPIYGTPRFHAGVDIGGACGQPIFAGENGTVLSAGSNGGYGLATVIDHGNGLSTLYGHQSSLGVSSGQHVGRGQQIGLVGTTGFSTGCHLHFEVRVNGQPVDPVPYLT